VAIQVDKACVSIPVRITLERWVECPGGCRDDNRSVWDLGSYVEKALPDVLTNDGIEFTLFKGGHQIVVHSPYGAILIDTRFKPVAYLSESTHGIAISIVGLTTVEMINDMVKFIKSILNKVGVNYMDFEMDVKIAM